MESIACSANVCDDEKVGAHSDVCTADDLFFLSKSLAYSTEGKSSDQAIDGKSDCRKLTKVASEKSIFSSIRERLDPLTSLLQEGLEGTKGIFDRKVKKAESVVETRESLVGENTDNVRVFDDPFGGTVDNGDTGNVLLGRSSSVEDRRETEELANVIQKSSSTDSFQVCKNVILCENNLSSSTSMNDDVMSDGTSRELSNFGDQCSLETSEGMNQLDISSHETAARHYSFESCDFTAKDLALSRPLQPLTVLLWRKSKLFILSHKIKIFSGVVFAALWLILPFPSFVSGLILGIVLASGVAWVLHCLRILTRHSTQEHFSTAAKDDLSVIVEATYESKHLAQVESFQGWMNEMPVYEQNDFHLNKTRSVYVTVNKSILRLETPKYNLHRRAMWQERLPNNPEFVFRREFSLTDAKVFLVPHGLVKKRLWCKKYPICVVASPTVSETETEHEEVNAGIDVLKAFDSIYLTSAARSLDDSVKDATFDPEVESVFVDEKDIQESKPKMAELFLFARANREKEEWYRRFVAGTQFGSNLKGDEPPLPAENSKSAELKTLPPTDPQPRTSSSSDSALEIQNMSAEEELPPVALDQSQADYLSYMSTLVQPKNPRIEDESKNDSPEIDDVEPENESLKSDLEHIPASPIEMDLRWLNALFSRFFFDFLHERSWAEKMKDKLQAMLCKIHVPQFIDQLTITDIELGRTMPAVGHVSVPYLDNRGLWIDMNISYSGAFSITMETKCNLMKASLSRKEDSSESPVHEKRSAVTHSDEEDSAESSSDEEYSEDCDIADESPLFHLLTVESATAVEDTTRQKKHSRRNAGSAASKRLLRLVDRITQSRYFQHAADYKYIKKALVEVSNTSLVLVVELSHLSGTLALNVPPPPTDRLWYGFKGNPLLQLSVKPSVGQRVVNVGLITEWIEKKLVLEFQRIYVIPNMEDLIIPLMCDDITCDSFCWKKDKDQDLK